MRDDLERPTRTELGRDHGCLICLGADPSHAAQDAYSGESGGSKPAEGWKDIGIRSGPTCAVCDRRTSGLLSVVPVCMEHVGDGQVEAALAEALAERDQANAFIAECSVCDGCGQNIGVYGWMRPFHSSVGPRALCSECMRKYIATCIAGEIDALEPRP